ncbi:MULTISPECIES: hypothetical protein [Bacillaceae]|uniref:Uncharacterized protein n=1 Tax=Bacillus subtilis subsp. natto TaxID=86029 RepID=E9RJ26_BACNA|nr:MULTISPECIES: hypothetical protein [Bacillaceae]ASB72336.1 hypothetical protein S100333_04477 [Bacillus subtilis subsp. subtilis]MBU2661773.1 hypothetical protein [Bacillus cabrialesii]MCM3335626.1 hypothetical protein [Bacillus subtilis]MCR8904322.1 hypothetical protein [Bacillus subtilis]MCY7751391.1 hypothetical protein [Bacillus inaquosorum]
MEKIKTIEQAREKMKELLADPQYNRPENYPERNADGTILLDENNELHQELR